MATDNEVSDLIAHIESEKSAHDPVEQEEIAEPRAEGAESTSDDEAETTDSQESTDNEEAQDNGTADQGETKTDATSKESDAHSKTDTETPKGDETKAVDWKATLPPPPPDYQGPEPEVDPETGQITNMTPQQYQQYVEEKTAVNIRKASYNNAIEGRALDIAEQILPEIKTNPTIRKMVENTRIASILSGNQIDTVQAATQVKEALGITDSKLLEAKTEGANNTKASITVQKNAALETGASKKGDSPDKTKELQKRIARGDDEAFAELLGIIDKH